MDSIKKALLEWLTECPYDIKDWRAYDHSEQVVITISTKTEEQSNELEG